MIVHTPGPWRVSGSRIISNYGGPDIPIAAIFTPKYGMIPESEPGRSECLKHFQDEEITNRRLMAASPDLLKKLEEIIMASKGVRLPDKMSLPIIEAMTLINKLRLTKS